MLDPEIFWQGCQNRSPGRRKSANLKGAPGLGKVPGWAWPRHLGSVLEASVRDPEECQECQLKRGIREITGPKSAKVEPLEPRKSARSSPGRRGEHHRY